MVAIGEDNGVVEALSIRDLRLRDGNGAVHTIPFSAVTKVVNMTKDFAYATFDISVGYSEDIDAAMRGGCNFPIGPFAVLDLVGLDTSVAILDALYDEFRDPHYAAVPLLRRMVTAGLLGRKSGRGFYEYGGEK